MARRASGGAQQPYGCRPRAQARHLRRQDPFSPTEVAELIESIPTNNLVGLRDRALIGLMAYTFARVGAALSMNVGDYYPEGKQWEKGGKRKQIAVHHVLEEYMDGYLDAAGIRDDKTTPLFRTAYIIAEKVADVETFLRYWGRMWRSDVFHIRLAAYFANPLPV